MERVLRVLRRVKGLYWYITGWFILNLLFLAKFPFMHSDESWLSGLTRSMMNGGIDSTETFFDLMPRFPHAIKTLFHLLQMAFSVVFGYRLFSFRLISLIFGAIALCVFYKIALLIFKKFQTAFWATIALSLCIQFIYASHFARQEIIILTGMLWLIYYMIKNSKKWTIKNDVATAAITGIFIGFHPNSFLIAMIVGSLYLYYIICCKKMKIKNLLTYMGTVALAAGVFIGLSFLLDGNFINHYLEYGSGLGISSPLSQKYDGIFYYYKKLFIQSGVTYYTPFIKGELIAFTAASVVSIAVSFWDKKILRLLLPLFALNLGFVLVGRFSQPGVIFIFPFGILLVFILLEKLIPKRTTIWGLAICCAIAVNSIIAIIPYSNNSYKEYLTEIEIIVPRESVVLANLNSEYAYAPGKMYDYRNLPFMIDNKTDFAGYIADREIEYIIYPEEMDFIYKRRPVWNVMYGNLYPYYDDMIYFLENECELVCEFNSPYAMRITQFANEKEWKIRIYKVKNE